MISIGGKTIDVYDDPGLKLLVSSPLFEKVGSLTLGDPAKLVDLEDRQFGVVFLTKKSEAIRKFPLNDFTNAVLSNIYFDMTCEKLPAEAKVAAATQIKEASAIFGFQPLPAVEKYAAEESLEGRNYVHLHKIASPHVDSSGILRELHDAYVTSRERYSREERIELAKAMAGAGEKFGFDIHEDLKPFAIKDPEIDKEAFFSQCALRKSMLQEKGAALHLIDELLEKHASFEPKETVKLLETFDKQFGLEEYWPRGLEPNLILQEKVAMHAIPLSPGSMQFSTDEVKEWAGSNGDLLNKMFGKELAAKIQKDPGAMWSLPQASRDFLTARIEASKDNTPVAAK